MRSFTRIAVALSYLCASTVMAHPHVRVAYQVDPVLDASGIRSLQVNWQLDAMTSAQIRENVDLNKNGVLDPDELQAFADGNHDLMKPSQFYLSLEQVDNPTPVPFEVTNYRATDAGFGFQGGVHISFTVNLPASSPYSDLKVRFFDPTWYMAMQPRPGSGVATSNTACHSELLSETRDTTLQGQQVLQFLFVQCAKGIEVRPTAQIFPATELANGDAL